MRKLIIFVSIALLGFGGAVLRRSAKEGPPHVHAAIGALAAVDVRQLTVGPASRTPNPEQVTARVSESESIPLNYPLQYVTDIKLDDRRYIYFETADLKSAKARVLRLNPELQRYDEIKISFANGKETPDSAVLQSYDVDTFGNVYMAIARPEALLIQDAGGAVLLEIDLVDFLPETISVDLEGNVWVGGRVLLSHNPVTADVTQIRVYSPTGTLLAIPASGFDKDDLRVGRFAHSGGRTELIAGARMHGFKEHGLAWAREYPFKIGQVRFSNTEKQPITQRQANRRLLGLSPVGKNLISYGVLPDEQGRGRNGFVALISRSGEALMSELLIPPEYGMPAAVGPDGGIYCLRKTEGKLVLTRIRVIDLPGKRGK